MFRLLFTPVHVTCVFILKVPFPTLLTSHLSSPGFDCLHLVFYLHSHLLPFITTYGDYLLFCSFHYYLIFFLPIIQLFLLFCCSLDYLPGRCFPFPVPQLFVVQFMLFYSVLPGIPLFLKLFIADYPISGPAVPLFVLMPPVHLGSQLPTLVGLVAFYGAVQTDVWTTEHSLIYQHCQYRNTDILPAAYHCSYHPHTSTFLGLCVLLFDPYLVLVAI